MNYRIEEIGYIDKGSGKHQSNVVYGRGGCHLRYVPDLALNTG